MFWKYKYKHLSNGIFKTYICKYILISTDPGTGEWIIYAAAAGGGILLLLITSIVVYCVVKRKKENTGRGKY